VRSTILKNKIASQELLDQIDSKIKVIVADSVKFAEESPFPDASEAFKDIYVQEDYPFVEG
jgi:pyruvate dehydrogenase E1 component alpha subunit